MVNDARRHCPFKIPHQHHAVQPFPLSHAYAYHTLAKNSVRQSSSTHYLPPKNGHIMIRYRRHHGPTLKKRKRQRVSQWTFACLLRYTISSRKFLDPDSAFPHHHHTSNNLSFYFLSSLFCFSFTIQSLVRTPPIRRTEQSKGHKVTKYFK